MLVIGLTGSIGMGKTTVAARFRERGIAVCDADAEVHKLYAGAAVAPIEAAFPGTTGPAGVDRQRLADALLREPGSFQRLEAIVHPLVQAAERAFLQAEAARGAKLAVLEVPLLFESGGHARCDATVAVSAPAAVQRARVLARPGMTAAKLDAILARQMPDAAKRARADFVVDTGTTLEATLAAVDNVIESLGTRTGKAYRRFWS
jgi:dephospho-CoA kinase